MTIVIPVAHKTSAKSNTDPSSGQIKRLPRSNGNLMRSMAPDEDLRGLKASCTWLTDPEYSVFVDERRIDWKTCAVQADSIVTGLE